MDLVRLLAERVDADRFIRETEPSPKLLTLFEMIIEGLEDSVLQQYFCTRTSRASLNQLKKRLLEKLIDFIAHNGVNSRLSRSSSMYEKCLRQMVASKSLTFGGAVTTSVKLAESTLRQCEKFDFTDVQLQLVKYLCYYYNTIDYAESKAKLYKKKLLDLNLVYSREIEVHAYFCDLRSEFIKSRGSIKFRIKKSDEYSQIVQEYLSLEPISYNIIKDSYHVLAMSCEIRRLPVQLINICDDALVRLSNIRAFRSLTQWTFDIYKVTAYIQLKEYALATKLLGSYEAVMTKGTFNWMVLKIYSLIAFMHSAQYVSVAQVAVQIRSGVVETVSSGLYQTWKVYEAHVEFLIAIGKIESDSPSPFRLNKFLNEIPLYASDKRGLNISILIIQVLFLLQRRKYSQIIDRTEALKQYCHRYLRKDDTFRSHCFIRMLLMMPKADFNRLRTERYAEPYLKKMKSVPLMISEQTIEVEVIPYEDLWEMTLELLD